MGILFPGRAHAHTDNKEEKCLLSARRWTPLTHSKNKRSPNDLARGNEMRALCSPKRDVRHLLDWDGHFVLRPGIGGGQRRRERGSPSACSTAKIKLFLKATTCVKSNSSDCPPSCYCQTIAHTHTFSDKVQISENATHLYVLDLSTWRKSHNIQSPQRKSRLRLPATQLKGEHWSLGNRVPASLEDKSWECKINLKEK